MADISDIIDLTITIEASGISRAGFGTILIGGWHDRTTGDRVSTFTKPADMLTEEDFVATDLEYIAASRIKAQSPAPRSFKVARLDSLANGPTQVMHLTAATAVSTTYGFELAITGSGTYQDVEYVSSATANAAEILNGLTAAVAALNSYSGNITAVTGTSNRIIISGASAGKHFALRALTNTFSNVTDETADPGVATDLANVLEEDSDWYALVLTYKGQAIQTAAAAAIESLRKVYITASMDKEIATSATDDEGSVLEAAEYSRTVMLFNDDHMNQPDAALAGVWMPYDPGSETVMFKQLTGITPTNLTASQLGHLRNKNVNYYVTYAGEGMVAQGKVSSGSYADLIRFVDWLFANIQEDLAALFLSVPKVPFSPAGITQVEGVIRAVLQRGVNVGGLLPGFTVTVPALEDVTTANKEARNLSPVTFSALSAGAIHGVEITGTVSV